LCALSSILHLPLPSMSPFWTLLWSVLTNSVDQFAFQPTGSTICALIQPFNALFTLLESTHMSLYLHWISLRRLTIRHSAVLDKFMGLLIPDDIYNGLEFLQRTFSLQDIMASIRQGSRYWISSFLHQTLPRVSLKWWATNNNRSLNRTKFSGNRVLHTEKQTWLGDHTAVHLRLWEHRIKE